MYSKNNLTVKPIIKETILQESCIVNHYVNLPNKYILLIAKNSDKTKTTLKLFSANNLVKSIKETTFDEEFRFRAVMPDSSILCTTIGYRGEYLIRICSEHLIIITNHFLRTYYCPLAVIDNAHFFIINQPFSRRLEHVLTLFNWNGTEFVRGNTLELSSHPNCGFMSGIKALGKNRYCCHLQGYNSNEFKILIFDVDPKNNTVNEIGQIKPDAQYIYADGVASGKMVILPNRQLLTYHKFHDNVQIWDVETLHCIKGWDWTDVKKPKNFLVQNLKIIPLPDSIHLLVFDWTNIYLFNMRDLVLKEISLKYKINPNAHHHVLPNGQIIIHTDHVINKSLKMIQFDLPEVAQRRKRIGDYRLSHQTCKRFFQSKLPAEISDQILSYAFTQETQKKFLEEQKPEDKKSNCLVM